VKPVVKIVLDTCVLYPTVMRAMLLGAARLGHFTPLWSPRIIEEWARAAIKLGPLGEAQARGEIALLRASWPDAERAVPPGLISRLWLPDADDVHVLALAVASSADAILTLNVRDFPRGTLAEEGLQRLDPDGFLHGLWLNDPERMAAVAGEVRAEADHLSGRAWEMRALLKKARLPRLAKALRD
jgi:predicted nucleic acid-binding protein